MPSTFMHNLGWDDARAAELGSLEVAHGHALTAARVSRVDRGALSVLTADGADRVRMSGRLFRPEPDGEPIGTPAVGDWVALEGPVAVAVLGRRSSFTRLSNAGATVAQVVAANIDTVFVVAPLVGRSRPRLVQRCLALAWESGATPVVLLTKSDLATDADERVPAAQSEAVGAEVHAVSATTGAGLGALQPYLVAGHTIAMIGASGAGKSTLTNALGAGTLALATGEVRDDGKGRHTTTARELVVLPSGAVAIDTPRTPRPRAVGRRRGHRDRVRRHHRTQRRLPVRRLCPSRRARMRGRSSHRTRRSGRREAGRLREAAARTALARNQTRQPRPRARARAREGLL
jgi:ribosome small subunit-dependent GTPase A